MNADDSTTGGMPRKSDPIADRQRIKILVES
jgi:hypothetical protein